MKKYIFVFAVIASALFVDAQNVFAYENVNQGCTICHSSIALHAVLGHTACINCHSSPSGGLGNVSPAKCIVCHPQGNPGQCNLVKLSEHAAQNCIVCHSECKSSCPAAQVLGDEDPRLVTLRDFRDKVLAKSAMGRRIITMYYNHADAINAALKKNPKLKAFSYKALRSFISVAEIFM